MPVILGLALLYMPTVWDLSRTLWQKEEYAHGPIILVVVFWLFWRAGLDRSPSVTPKVSWLASILFGMGLLIYMVGRSQSIILFEVGSIIPVAAGLVLLLQGADGLRRFWFPILFLLFFVPLPTFVNDGLSGALKPAVSAIAEALLYQAGYPISRSGVIINIGHYQLLVADACSGISSMFSLSALGLLYLYLTQQGNLLRTGVLLASILPLAFAANIVRVIVLVLITYHLGDAAGQGFAHNFAGMVLFIAALVLLVSLDWLLGRFNLARGDRQP
jgi:exosortase B